MMYVDAYLTATNVKEDQVAHDYILLVNSFKYIFVINISL